MTQNELRSRWLLALRSGKYKQGQHSLRPSQRKWCCLGVCLNEYNPKEWSISKYGSMYFYGDLDEEYELTDEALFVLGITDSQQQDLIKMNDEGATFPEIADFLEQEIFTK